MQRRHFCAMAGASLLPAVNAAAATPFPNRMIRVICPYAAGGGPDVQLRQMAPVLGEALGQSIVIDNKVGAGGVLGAQYVAAQPADGYTLLQLANTHLVQKIMTPGLKFDPLNGFAPITNMSMSPTVLVVPADSPYQRAEDLIAAAKAAPGKLNYSSGGIGTSAHLAGATFAALPKLNVTHIPLKGSVEITASLLRGDTQFAFPVAGTGVPQVKGGKLRALAVTSAKRMPQLPDVPTLEEVLKSKLAVQESWFALSAPAGTPKEAIARLFTAFTGAMKVPAVRKAIQDSGGEPAPSASTEECAAFVRAENAKWGEIVRLAGITAS